MSAEYIVLKYLWDSANIESVHQYTIQNFFEYKCSINIENSWPE